MRTASSWKFLISASLAAAAAAQPVTTEVDAVRESAMPDRTTTTQDIAFTADRHERMTVPVRLSGKGPYRFLVDTGADRTAVSTALAAELGLSSGPMATLHSVTGTSEVRTANIPRLELSSNRVRSLDAPLLERAYMGADGILGVDSLRSQKVMFDFKKQIISIVPSIQNPPREEEGTIVVHGKIKRGHLIVTQARIEGARLTVVLDTGSEMTIGNSALRSKLEAQKKLGPSEPIEMMSVTGRKLVGEAFRVKQTEIGGVELRNLEVVFANAPIFRSLNLENRPAVLLGMNVMRAFDKVSIDFARRQLRMVVPEHSSLEGAVMAAR